MDRGHHRGASPVDVLIAACAHIHGVGVLHYDRDYDLLVEVTALAFESQWLAGGQSLMHVAIACARHRDRAECAEAVACPT